MSGTATVVGGDSDGDPGGGRRRGRGALALPMLILPAVAAMFAAALVASSNAGDASSSDGLGAVEVLIFAGLLSLSALFSGAESALTAVNSVRVKTEADEGNAFAIVVMRLISDRSRMISALLIGNNVVNTGLATYATVVFSKAFAELGPDYAAALAAGVSVLMLLVFGEVIPKTVGVNLPKQVSYAVAYPILLLRFCMWPVTILLTGLQRATLRLFRHDPDAESAVTGAEIEALGRLAEGQGILSEGAGDAIAKMVTLHETYVREVITPRIDLVAVPVTATYAEVIHEFRTHRFSRLPVYDNDLDGIVGVLTIRDVLGLTAEEQAGFNAFRASRRPVFVPELKKVSDLIIEMRRERNHFAIVVDEYGGTAGVVTLEDLLEAVVGQIEDEFDEGSPRIRSISSNVLLVDGGVTISELEQKLKFTLPDVEGVDTVAGLFLSKSEKIPSEGDSLTFYRVEVVVRKMRGQRIVRLLVRIMSETE